MEQISFLPLITWLTSQQNWFQTKSNFRFYFVFKWSYSDTYVHFRFVVSKNLIPNPKVWFQ